LIAGYLDIYGGVGLSKSDCRRDFPEVEKILFGDGKILPGDRKNHSYITFFFQISFFLFK
jgi:hypothetical protein